MVIPCPSSWSRNSIWQSWTPPLEPLFSTRTPASTRFCLTFSQNKSLAIGYNGQEDSRGGKGTSRVPGLLRKVDGWFLGSHWCKKLEELKNCEERNWNANVAKSKETRKQVSKSNDESMEGKRFAKCAIYTFRNSRWGSWNDRTIYSPVWRFASFITVQWRLDTYGWYHFVFNARRQLVERTRKSSTHKGL